MLSPSVVSGLLASLGCVVEDVHASSITVTEKSTIAVVVANLVDKMIQWHHDVDVVELESKSWCSLLLHVRAVRVLCCCSNINAAHHKSVMNVHHLLVFVYSYLFIQLTPYVAFASGCNKTQIINC